MNHLRHVGDWKSSSFKILFVQQYTLVLGAINLEVKQLFFSR